MCGIAGIVRRDPREAVDEARLKGMRDVLRHRGPDGEGLLLGGPVGLGHRRLAIIDVAGGQQPMANEDGTIWIVYNGEIYNHAALRPGLEARGHRYRTRSDAETVLHAYEEDGERCVERLQGMFAFALWDRPRGRMLLARDRLGIKPLYYAVARDELLFASEIKAILAALPGRPVFNRRVVPEFLATRFVSGQETFFEGIHKLLPGRTLTWSAGEGLRTRRYWRLPTALDAAPDDAAARARRLRDDLTAAVRSHLMTDVPLGLFLSGGLDSTALAVLMAKMVAEPVRTFSVGFDDPDANELGCFWEDHKADNPDFKLATVTARTWLVRVALRKAVGAVQGISDTEPSIIVLPLAEDSTSSEPALAPKCVRTLPPDAILSTMLPKEKLEKLFAK